LYRFEADYITFFETSYMVMMLRRAALMGYTNATAVANKFIDLWSAILTTPGSYDPTYGFPYELRVASFTGSSYIGDANPAVYTYYTTLADLFAANYVGSTAAIASLSVISGIPTLVTLTPLNVTGVAYFVEVSGVTSDPSWNGEKRISKIINSTHFQLDIGTIGSGAAVGASMSVTTAKVKVDPVGQFGLEAYAITRIGMDLGRTNSAAANAYTTGISGVQADINTRSGFAIDAEP
jgi:hypothetical protein